MSVDKHNLATAPVVSAPAAAWPATETLEGEALKRAVYKCFGPPAQTVIELGTGMGSSAVWMADLLKAFDIESHIYSVDLNKPELHYDRITFLRGDCLKIETVFPSELLETAPHPWLFVEAAHVNVYGVLTYFHQFFTTGDYVVVEDSGSKHEAIGKFLARHSGCYKLDTRYTDFFGRNATCARDSIFVRI